MKKKETDRILEIHDTAKEVTDILYKWSLDKIRRFREWLRENQDSDNTPWENKEG